MSSGDQRIIGLISDTHGLLRADVRTALSGVELILHAGDIGGDDILDELERIAPVRAVFGNTDPPGNPRLTDAIDIEVGSLRIHVSHGHEVGAPTPETLLARYDADVIVYGHTHTQSVVSAGGRWAINPGAAGPRRFNLLPSVGRLRIENGRPAIEIVDLTP